MTIGATMFQSIDIQDVAPMSVACTAHRGPYNQIGAAFVRLAKWAGPRGLFKSGARTIGVYYDSPRVTPPEQLRSDACIECDDSVIADPGAGVEVKIITGGKYVVGVYKGPYAGLPQAWEELIGVWMRARSLTIAPTPCFEVYLNEMESTPPDELLTAIHVPIE
jgi:AraC family transcriptional regulator